LITGASSGIGAALARAYAAPGITLFLGGRHEDRLSATAAACRAAGAEALARGGDVMDDDAMAAWVRSCDEHRPLDLVIANAGISAGTGGGGETAEQARRIFAVNVDGVLNTVLPAVNLMRARRSGQIALMSSLAAFRGFPGAPAYCASKAAVRIWGEALRGWLAHDGVRLSVICPGFIKTPMSESNPYPMPFLMKPDRAAEVIVRGLARNRGRIAFPLPVYLFALLIQSVPPAWTDRALVGLPRKPSNET